MKTPSQISSEGIEEFEKQKRDVILLNKHKLVLPVEWVRTFQKSQEAKMLESVNEWAVKIKERYHCGACDGAKCGHTQCCQVISDLQSFIQEEIIKIKS